MTFMSTQRSMLASTLFCLSLCTCYAQNQRVKSIFDASAGIGKDQYTASVSWIKNRTLGNKKQWLKIGYGVRLTSYLGSKKGFITAPARLTSRQTGPQVLFSKTFKESLDTVYFDHAQINSLNVLINLEGRLVAKLDVGFNIDALGFSFGKKQSGTLQSTLRPSELAVDQSAKPTPFNVLLISDNDIGTLNSEFFARYWFKEHLAIKVAFGFHFTEYTTENKLIFDNDRFRNKVSVLVLGIIYHPFANKN